MKIFAIRDDGDSAGRDVAFLLYYEQSKQFYIELPENADPWHVPLLLSSFLKKGERTVNAYWSKLWVQQRIVPPDRQNLGQILKEHHMESYDEFDLLILANGRCAQDDYYLVPITEAELPNSFVPRYQYKVEDVVPLAGYQLLVFFRDGSVKKCDVRYLSLHDHALSPVTRNEKLFHRVVIQTGGYGVCWGETTSIADSELYTHGITIPLSQDDFEKFVIFRIVNTAEAAELLHCSRQNIDDLVRRSKLHPVKTTPKGKWFFKSEIIQRGWK